MKIFKCLLLVIVAISFSTTVIASDFACVQYQRQDYSWGDAYRVPYFIVEGGELQKATNDFRKYKSYTKYAVVEWPNGGYSAMELKTYESDVSLFRYSNTKDQNDRTYRIRKAPSFGNCPTY